MRVRAGMWIDPPVADIAVSSYVIDWPGPRRRTGRLAASPGGH